MIFVTKILKINIIINFVLLGFNMFSKYIFFLLLLSACFNYFNVYIWKP